MVEELIKYLAPRFAALSDEEKDAIRSLVGTPQGRALTKLFGPDIMSQINLTKPSGPIQRRGLATR